MAPGTRGVQKTNGESSEVKDGGKAELFLLSRIDPKWQTTFDYEVARSAVVFVEVCTT